MTDERHICIITSSSISEDGIGGEGKYSILLYNWLKSRNIKSTLLGSKSIKIKTFDPAYKYKKIISGKNRSKKKISLAPYPLFMTYRLVISLFLSVKIFQLHFNSPISLIHSQDTGYTGLAAIVVGKILRVPVIVSSHGIRHRTIHHSLRSRLKGIIFRIERNLDTFTVKNANEVIVDNDAIKNYFEKIVKKRIKSIPIPIRLDEFEYSLSNRTTIRSDLGCDESTKIIGFIGRFAPEKNLISLLTVFSKLLQNSFQAKLVLVGTGPLESEMKNYVSKMNMADNVIFCGVRNDINKILSSFDIFILPSFTEGMSVALLEAMATGCAIICSKIPTNAEIISDRKEGILIDPHNLIEMEKVIRELIEDDLLRSELKCNAEKKAIQFDINVVFPKVILSYDKLIGRPLH
ncbi:glycosyltransferase family 4 protein [Candidatus Nitrosocosmicus arcticus]|uniref:Glycosyl transferase, family 1 n=1 Tax=Candidatus Nitrosocosmicus arcticus TaxID=2035267 RepID=A0A557SYM3_9ARCH|nr:glycosyltransferase family 4 protein [Candidatus Nitrosocosmicus arcticus]TVP41701.1 Glycosyl transferase, family 1 [Candidatus Nitrosocosmicus arcticus]